MPYRRESAQPPPASVLVPIFEKAIKSLVRRFRNHPYAFYTETDMHCYLYHRLYSGGLVNGLYKTKEGHETILLHKEYPTISRYQRHDDGRIYETPTGRRRGAYDISIWDPAYVKTQAHRKQKVLCAAELALNECGTGNVHTLNDATKLAGKANEIRYGYLLYFVRDDKRYEKNKEQIWSQLSDASMRVRVAFCRVHTDTAGVVRKPKPKYCGDWGKV